MKKKYIVRLSDEERTECELSTLSRQRLSDRRIGHLSDLQREIAAWATLTNNKQRSVDWHFKIDHAHSKLKRLYLKLKSG